jgi:hypothetical protein
MRNTESVLAALPHAAATTKSNIPFDPPSVCSALIQYEAGCEKFELSHTPFFTDEEAEAVICIDAEELPKFHYRDVGVFVLVSVKVTESGIDPDDADGEKEATGADPLTAENNNGMSNSITTCSVCSGVCDCIGSG